MWIKICGVRDFAVVQAAESADANAIGLNFVPTSKRCVSRDVAARIVEGVDLACVGVFQDTESDEIVKCVRDTKLSFVQLHGVETPEFVQDLAVRLPEVRIIRAFCVDEASLTGVGHWLRQAADLGISLWGCLIDGPQAGAGERAPWQAIGKSFTAETPRLILAGGLTPQNVADAIATVDSPFLWGVDTASGVEVDGNKSPQRISEFVTAVRQAS